MITVSEATTGNEWNSVVESVINDKPVFIDRTRDTVFFSDISVIEIFLSAYSFHAEIIIEDDGSHTLILDEIDLAENASDLPGAVNKLAASILNYAHDFYNDFLYWSRGDRKNHVPYIFKALILNDPEKIGGVIVCRHGGI